MKEPYLGGYNSDEATILIVKFRPMQEISSVENPRWKKQNFREMVNDMQDMLLTGGVRTNIFRQGQDEIVVVMNDKESLESAKLFFDDKDEVLEVRVGNNQERKKSGQSSVVIEDL